MTETPWRIGARHDQDEKVTTPSPAPAVLVMVRNAMYQERTLLFIGLSIKRLQGAVHAFLCKITDVVTPLLHYDCYFAFDPSLTGCARGTYYHLQLAHSQITPQEYMRTEHRAWLPRRSLLLSLLFVTSFPTTFAPHVLRGTCVHPLTRRARWPYFALSRRAINCQSRKLKM